MGRRLGGALGIQSPLTGWPQRSCLRLPILPWRPLLHLHLPLKGGGEVCLPSGILFLGFLNREQDPCLWGVASYTCYARHVFKRNKLFTLPLMYMPMCRSSETQSGRVYKTCEQENCLSYLTPQNRLRPTALEVYILKCLRKQSVTCFFNF